MAIAYSIGSKIKDSWKALSASLTTEAVKLSIAADLERAGLAICEPIDDVSIGFPEYSRKEGVVLVAFLSDYTTKSYGYRLTPNGAYRVDQKRTVPVVDANEIETCGKIRDIIFKHDPVLAGKIVLHSHENVPESASLHAPAPM